MYSVWGSTQNSIAINTFKLQVGEGDKENKILINVGQIQVSGDYSNAQVDGGYPFKIPSPTPGTALFLYSPAPFAITPWSLR